MLDLELTGKVAIVTGGSAGLGRAAAIKLAREGARVSICARRKEVLERTAGEIRQAGGEVLAIPADVTRAAGINLTKGLANEYASSGIRVNTICLGLVKSEQWERRAKGGDVEAVYREGAKRVPIGRMGEAEEFGDLVAFLVSARAAFITGTAINFDGGMATVV